MALRRRDHLLVHGYIRENCEEFKIYNFIIDLMDICFDWYHLRFEILKWSEEYRTKGNLELSDDNKCFTRTGGLNYVYNYQWIIADTEPVFTGIHCWRLQQQNPKEGWINIGIGAKRMYKDNSFAPETVWGIAHNGCWYGDRGPEKSRHLWADTANRNDTDVSVFEGSKGTIEIDMYLDADEGYMKFIVVGTKKDALDKTEAKLFKMPINTKHGYVPYINTASTGGQQLRIAKISPDWYNIHKDCVF